MVRGASRIAGLFVPKSSRGAVRQRRGTRGLQQAVRACPLASTAVGGDCHSLRHLVVRGQILNDCCPHTPRLGLSMCSAWNCRTSSVESGVWVVAGVDRRRA